MRDPFPFRFKEAIDMENLFDDFSGAEIAKEPFFSRGAKSASCRASYLARDAHGAAISRHNQDRFNPFLIG
jgi:hypothetical protein